MKVTTLIVFPFCLLFYKRVKGCTIEVVRQLEFGDYCIVILSFRVIESDVIECADLCTCCPYFQTYVFVDLVFIYVLF
jgi:hypothetical protein